MALLLGFTIAGNRNYSNTKYPMKVIDTSQMITGIQRDYAEINRHKKMYKVLEKDVPGETTEGGFIAVYCDGNSPREIIAINYGETGKTIEEYYFNQNGLFFAFVQGHFYNKPMYLRGSKVVRTTEDRYYFNKKMMLKWVNNKKVKNAKSPEFASEAMTVSHDAEKLWRSIVDCKGKTLVVVDKRDTVRCKNGSDCSSTGYIINGSRDTCGHVIHVNPKNKNVPLEK
jgi:hypothetical protein